MAMSELQQFHFLPNYEVASVKLLFKTVFLQAIHFCLISIILAFVITIMKRREKEKKQKEIAKTSEKLLFLDKLGASAKEIVGYSYIFVWCSLLFYAISLINFSFAIKSIISKQSIPMIIRYIAVALQTTISFKAIVSVFINFGGVFLLLLTILVIYYIAVILTNVSEKPMYIRWAIPGFIKQYSYAGPTILGAFQTVNKNIKTLSKFIILPACILTIQLASVAFIITSCSINIYYTIPLLLLVDWAYNFTMMYCRFFIFQYTDKAHLKEGEEKSYTRNEYFNVYLDICYNSLKKTCALCILTIPKMLLKIPYFDANNFSLVKKLVRWYDSTELLLSSMVVVSEYVADRTIFELAIKNNYSKNTEYLQKKYKVKIEETDQDDITEQITNEVFSQSGVFFGKIAGWKNVIIKSILNISIITNYIIASDFMRNINKIDTSVSESRGLFTLVSSQMSLTSIIVLFLYLILMFYIVALESAYIMGKKKKAEKQIFDDYKKRKEEEERKRLELAEKTGALKEENVIDVFPTVLNNVISGAFSFLKNAVIQLLPTTKESKQESEESFEFKGELLSEEIEKQINSPEDPEVEWFSPIEVFSP